MVRRKKSSVFMMDSTEGEANKESIMDFEVSWVLRMAADHECAKRPVLHMYCRNFLELLIGRKLSKQTRIKKVETWKQYKKIDLWVRIILEENGNIEQHEILIEDKVFSPLKENQLQNNRRIFDDYMDMNYPNAKRHYLLLVCMESYDSKLRMYSESPKWGYTLIPWDKMVNAMFKGKHPICSESDIFNEFWIYDWD